MSFKQIQKPTTATKKEKNNFSNNNFKKKEYNQSYYSKSNSIHFNFSDIRIKNTDRLIQRKPMCTCGGKCSEYKTADRLTEIPNFQTKLKISKPNDPYEQEADRLAKQVASISKHNAIGGEQPQIQNVGQPNGKVIEPSVNIDRVLASPGSPLEPKLQHDLEHHFDHDFSRVRVHADSAASQSAHDMNADAYTLGHDIVFGKDQFAPQTDIGLNLLAHELTHVVQQEANIGIPHGIMRRELGGGFFRRSIGPGDWYFSDRQQWQQASIGGYISRLPQGNTFILAAIYNTQNLRDTEYQTISERHDYYDLMSYAIEYDPKTPSVVKNVRFFSAATIVTGSPGIRTVDTYLGLLKLSENSRNILREVNAELFRANMRVIRDLLFNWREPRHPQNPSGMISAFEFDVHMVELEQDVVANYIQKNRGRFTSGVEQDINKTLDPSSFGQSWNPYLKAFQWAITALGIFGISNLDFTIKQHRMAIGFAAIHILHGKTFKDYAIFMTRKMMRLNPRTAKTPDTAIYTISNRNGVILNDGIPGPWMFEKIPYGTQVQIIDNSYMIDPLRIDDEVFAGKVQIEVLPSVHAINGLTGWVNFSDLH